jgi:hypothetical protein
MRNLIGLTVAALALVGVMTAAAHAENKAVKSSKEWTGSVADEKLSKDAPVFISDAKELAKLWTSWKVGDKVPDIDFNKEIVVVSTTVGSKLSLSCKLDDKGNLQVLGLGTRDLVPGFRYVIATVSRDGVKTVDGKELPKP